MDDLPGADLVGTGTASGSDRAQLAARQAVASIPTERVSQKPRAVGVQIRAGADITLDEVYDAVCVVNEALDPGEDGWIVTSTEADPGPRDGELTVNVYCRDAREEPRRLYPRMP